MGLARQIICCPVLICLVALALANDSNLEVGDACQITRTGNQGICQFMADCAEALYDLRFNALLPISCGYRGTNQIVCCPIKEPVKLNETATREEFSTLRVPISVQKCQEYSRYVFINITATGFDSSEDALISRIDRCGHSSAPLIVGGTPAASREFPHSALLGYKRSDGALAWDCGGSLISTRYILTAGHCLKSHQYNVTVSVVRLGELVLNDETDEATAIDVPVSLIITHPDYLKYTRYNDIALLKLAHKVILSPFIRPICLPTNDLDPPKSIATGWGALESDGLNSNALLKVVLEAYNNQECNDFFLYNLDRKLRKGIIETQLCAGSRTESKDTCQGDSGGPLQIYHPDTYCMYTQVGITSFGIGCGTVNFPGVYTRLYNYVEWIEKIVWARREDD